MTRLISFLLCLLRCQAAVSLAAALWLFPAAGLNAAVVFQAAGTAVSGTGGVSPAWPAHAEGDIALLFVESGGSQAVSFSNAQGFVEVPGSPQTTDVATSAGTRLTVFWARATSAAMAAPDISDPGDHVYARILTYRGAVPSGNPWDLTQGGVKTAASGVVSVTGLTTTVAATLIVQAVSHDRDDGGAQFSAQANAALSGITERSDGGTNSGNGGGIAIWDGAKAVAGATGNTSATLANSVVNAFLTIALKPAVVSINSVLLNGATSVSVGAGATVSAVVNATVATGGAWRSTGWRIAGSSGVMACINHADRTTAGTYNETFNVTAPASSGTYNGYFVAYSDDTCNSAASTTFAMTGAVAVLSQTEFNSTGGTSATNGLHFYLEDTTKMQVRRLNNTGQVYSPTALPPSDNLDNGIFIRANGLVYGPSHTVGSDYFPSGGMYNTFSITQATPANPTTSGVQQTATGTFGINAGPQVSVLWKYTTPLDFLTAEVTLTIPAGYAVSAGNPVRYYHVFDTFLGGSDNGCGVSFLDNGKRVIGTYPPSSGTTCPSNTAIPAGVSVVESFRERSGQAFSNYCASYYYSFFDTSTPNCSVRQAASMSNTVSTTYQDTGIGIELDFTAPGTYTFSYDFVVGTPQVPAYDHIEIRHDGSAGLCSETVTVLACTSSTVPCPELDIVNTGTLTGSITTSPTSPAVTKTPTSFTLGSSASTQSISLLAAGAGTFTLGASGMSATPLNGTKCWNTATSTASCTLTVTNTPCLGGYECIETGSTYNNLNTSPSARNPLFTKLSGTGFKFDVVALQSSGAVATSYTASSNVTVELFDDSASPQPACSAYSGPVASQAITFAAGDNGRKTLASNVSVANVYPRLRCRVRDTNVSPTIYACSSDSFAVRPPAVSLNTTASAVAPSSTAATTVQAGSNFTLGATTSAGTNYQGNLTLDTNKLTAQTTTQDATQVSGGTVGTLTPSTLPTNPATPSSNNATYSEVGYLYLAAGAYRDDSFTAVDSATGDCVTSTTGNANLADTLDANGKYGCSIGNKTAVSLGRFIPHHFDTTVTQGCPASNFTYSAQPFAVTATARNASGGATGNYQGVFARETAITDASGAGVGAMSANTITATTFINGVATASPVYTFDNRATVPTALALRASDGEASSAGFTEAAATIRSGRVRLLNAYGSERLDLPMAMRAEFWNGGWQLNAADTCTTTNLAFANVSGPANFNNNTCVRDSGNPGASGMGCAAAGVAARQFREAGVTGFAGDFNLWLQAPLVAGAINVTAAVPAWLQFPWAGAAAANPTARATFGVYRSPLIYRRENY